MRINKEDDDFYALLHSKVEEGTTDEELTVWWMSLGDLQNEEFFIPNKTQIQMIREEFQQPYHAKMDLNIALIKEWFKLQPHLPQPQGSLVRKFLWAAKGDVEQAKKMMTQFYLLRGTDDETFANRDPCTARARRTSKTSLFTCLPGYTKELYRVNLSTLISHDPDDFDTFEWMKRLFYLTDMRVLNDFCLGDIMIYDLNGFSLNHLMKWPLSLAKKLNIATEGALPCRIKQIHFVNCPPYIDRILSMFKPFMKEKIAKRIFIHMNTLDELYKHVPKEMLPCEYGGDAGTLTELSDNLMHKFELLRDWYITEEKNIKRIYMEAKKNGKLFVDCGELYGMEGSFKKLNID